MTEADSKNAPAISTAQTDPREDGTQLRPGLWETINERYPGSMIRKDSYVPLAQLGKPLAEVARDVTELIQPPVRFSCPGQWAIILEFRSIETSRDGYCSKH